MKKEKTNRIQRVLGLYTKILTGILITKAEEAEQYGVDERTIQRDLEDIREFLESEGWNSDRSSTLIYDCLQRGYRLNQLCKRK